MKIPLDSIIKIDFEKSSLDHRKKVIRVIAEYKTSGASYRERFEFPPETQYKDIKNQIPPYIERNNTD